MGAGAFSPRLTIATHSRTFTAVLPCRNRERVRLIGFISNRAKRAGESVANEARPEDKKGFGLPRRSKVYRRISEMLKGSKKINDKAEVFKFRLTKDEREKLKRLAEEKNCSSGELLRRYINDEYIKFLIV